MANQFETVDISETPATDDFQSEWPAAQNVHSLFDRAPMRQPMLAQSGLPLDWWGTGPVEARMTVARRLRLVIKRGLDVAVALAALVILSPLLLTIAAAIRLSSRGPALFRQPRVGFKGQHFRIFKFRTMYADKGDPSGRKHTVQGDDRVTPLGRLLRRTSLDELPQLLNVLLGDMSLVGPRPHVVRQFGGDRPYEELVPYYDMRHTMKPGITGWAQMNGLRGPTDDAERAIMRVDHDIAYIQQFTLILDLRILLGTVRRELINSSAF